MLASVPTAWRSAGPGLSTVASRCRTTPMGWSSRTACWAAAMDRGRPMAIGATMPGNSTTLRTGRMMRASAGSDAEAEASWAPGEPAPEGATPAGRSKRITVRSPSSGFGEAETQAALGREAAHGVVAAGGQQDAPLEAPLRQFEAMDDGGPQFARQDAPARHHERAVLDRRFHAIGIDARQRHKDEDFALGFDHVDGRLPGGLARLRLLQAEDLPVHALGARQRFDGFREHPVHRIAVRHAFAPREQDA